MLKRSRTAESASSLSPAQVCQCGHLHFAEGAEPLARFVCHCSLCQHYMGGPFNDECFFVPADVTFDPNQLLESRNYRGFSPLARGRCRACELPLISVARVMGLKLLLVPSELAVNQNQHLPAPHAHVFYESRVADAVDEVAKYHGFLASQWMTQWFLLRGWMRRPRATG